MMIAFYSFRLLILFQLAASEARLHRLNTIYTYSKSQDLRFHCDTMSNQKAIIVIYSKNRVNIVTNQIVHEIQQDYWYQIYSASQCLEYVNITSTDNFEILQQLESAKQLDINKPHQLYRNYRKLMQFKFQILKQHLFIIKIANYMELQEQITFILTNGLIFYKLQRADNSNYIHVLSSDNYQLFILGPRNLIISIQLQIEYVHQQFIWINQENELSSDEYQSGFNSYIYNSRADLQFYAQLIMGSCNVVIKQQELTQNEEPQQLTLKKHNLYILEKPLKIFFTGQPFIILYQFLNDVQQLNFDKLIIYASSPYDPIPICFANDLDLQQNNSDAKLIKTMSNHEYSVELQFNQTPQIFSILLKPQIINIPNQDMYQLVLPYNSSIVCKVVLDRYLFNVMNGQFNYNKIENNLIQINTLSDTIIDLIIPQVRQFKKIVFNQVYKLRKSSKFYFIANNKFSSVKINLFPPDIQFSIYHDYELKQQQTSGNKIDLAYQSKQYRYVLITSDIEYYVQFQKGAFTDTDTIGQTNVTMLFNVDRIYLAYQLFETLYFFGFQEVEVKVEYRSAQMILAVFKYVHPIIIVLNKQAYPFKRLIINDFHRLLNSRIYLFYLQRNFVILVLDEFKGVQQLQVTIMNPQLEVLYDTEVSHQQDILLGLELFLDETSIISIDSKFVILNLSFFECQRLDCVIQLQLVSEEYNNSIKYQTCFDVNVGLMDITETLYACQSLEQFDIIPLSNHIQVYLQYNLIQCQDIQCPIIIKYPNMTLDQIQETTNHEFTIKLNQLNVNVQNHFTHIIFYNNVSQQIYIHADNQNFELQRLTGAEFLPINRSSGVIDQGYYSINSDNQMYSYLTVFTYPTMLYENITFDIIDKELFVIDQTNKKYVLIEKSINSSITSNLDKQDSTLMDSHYTTESIKSISNNRVEFQGNGSITCYYIDNPCHFIVKPKLTFFINKSLNLIAEINSECQIQSIEFIFGNISQRTNQSHIQLMFINFVQEINPIYNLDEISYKMNSNQHNNISYFN